MVMMAEVLLLCFLSTVGGLVSEFVTNQILRRMLLLFCILAIVTAGYFIYQGIIASCAFGESECIGAQASLLSLSLVGLAPMMVIVICLVREIKHRNNVKQKL